MKLLDICPGESRLHCHHPGGEVMISWLVLAPVSVEESDAELTGQAGGHVLRPGVSVLHSLQRARTVPRSGYVTVLCYKEQTRAS